MNKKSILSILLALLAIAMFNLVFFLGDIDSLNQAAWISYAFIHIAFLLTIAVCIMPVNDREPIFLGLTCIAISIAYLIIEIIVGSIFIVINPESFKLSLIIQCLILVGFAFVCLPTALSNEKTRENVDKERKDASFISNALYNVNDMIGRTDDEELKKDLRTLRDLLTASQIKSSEQVRSMEYEMISLLTAGKEQLNAGQIQYVKENVKEAKNILKTRNDTLKALN